MTDHDMPTRKHLYAELAATFLLWVEEEADILPWKGHVLRRPRKLTLQVGDKLVEQERPPWYRSFIATSETRAREDAERTIANVFPDYKPYLPRLEWKQSELSDEEWETKLNWYRRA